MTIQFAIKPRGPAPGNAERDCALRTAQRLPRRTATAAAAAPTSRVDPTVKAMVSGRSAPPAHRRYRGSRYEMLEAIVTLGTVVGFTVALALMTGEWLRAPTVDLTQTVVAKCAPKATPTVVAGSTIEPRAVRKPL